MFSLEGTLAPSHSLLIQHSELLTPQEVRSIVECYGIIDDVLSYRLKEDRDYVSVIQYCDVVSRELCYASMRALISLEEIPIKKVGWIREDDVPLLIQKKYIQPLSPIKQDNELSPAKGCLVVYLSNISNEIRPQFLFFVGSQDLIELFVDSVNGGRCFICSSTIETAEEVRRAILHHYPECKKDIHYCDYNDFLLAKGKGKHI